MRIAAAQVHPAWLDAARSAEIATDWLARAAADDIELLAFGETFLGGYPFWVSLTDGARFDAADQKQAYAAYLDAAVELDGPELRRIAEAAADHRVFTYVGAAERATGPASGTVYATLVAIDPERGIVGAHRKLMPTYEERLVWGTGDGHGLRVHRLPGGARVGGLNCWENWMPLARHAMYAGGEEIHVAAWPGSSGLTREITRFIAREGRVFALSAGTLLQLADVPDTFPLKAACREALGEERAAGILYDGGSAIAGPDGAWLVEPVSGEERLVAAEIDLAAVRGERQNFDPTGHYARPDVFEVRVDRRRLAAAEFDDGPTVRNG